MSVGVDTLLDIVTDCLRFVTETYGAVPKWTNLEQFDPKSQEYLLLLTSLLDDPIDRRATTALMGEGASIVLEILAKVRVRRSF